MPKFKNAFKCSKCPESNQEEGCPLWWEIIMTNDVTQEQKIEKGCGYQLLPQMIALTCKQSMHTTYAAYDMRNKVVKNLGKVFSAISEKLKISNLQLDTEEIKMIEEGEK